MDLTQKYLFSAVVRILSEREESVHPSLVLGPVEVPDVCCGGGASEGARRAELTNPY